jgi:hypothetical protein
MAEQNAASKITSPTKAVLRLKDTSFSRSQVAKVLVLKFAFKLQQNTSSPKGSTSADVF